MVGPKRVSSSRRATPYDRPSEHARADIASPRRDSTLGSMRRSLSHAFGRIVGRNDPPLDASKIEENDIENADAGHEIASRSILLEHPSNESRSDISRTEIPSLPRRVNSLASIKPQINWSLIQSSPDMRLPAHVIVEAYREALENRALQQKVQQRHLNKLRHAQDDVAKLAASEESARPHDKLVNSNPDRTLPSMIDQTPSSSILGPATTEQLPRAAVKEPLNHPRVASKAVPFPESIRHKRLASVKPKRTAHSVAKARPRPIKSRIQLVSRPIIDISNLSEERKKGPGYYTANFDISSSDEEDAAESNKAVMDNKKTSERSSQFKEPALMRRPQVESSKLKNRLESVPLSAQPTTASSLSNSFVAKSGTGEGAKPAQEKPDLFGKVHTSSSTNDKPTFSFSQKNEHNANEHKAQEPSTGKALFSFGKSNDTSVSKPSAGFSFGKPSSNEVSSKKPESSTGTTTSAKPNPTFSFLNPEKPAQLQKEPADTNETNKQASTGFSFGKPSAISTDASSASKPSFDFSKSAEKVANKQPFSLGFANNKINNGSSNGNDADKKVETPSQPSFSFGANTSTAKPAFVFGANKDSSSATDSAPASSLAPKAATPSFTFGASSSQATTAAKPAEAKAPAFVFGSSETSTGANPQPAFGAPLGQTTAKVASPALSRPTATTATSAPIFGSNGGATSNSGTATGGFQFGKPNGENKAASSFGAGSSKPPQGNVFGNVDSTSSGAKPAFTFGAPQSTDNQNSTSASTISSTNGAANGAAFTFGSGTASAPFKYGTPSNNNNAPAFGAPLGSAASTTANNASRLGTPAFGTQTSSASPAPAFTFGQSQPAAGSTMGSFQFGNQAGTSAVAPAFGSNSNQPAMSFGFGGQAGATGAATNNMNGPSGIPSGNAAGFPNNTAFGSRDTTPSAGNVPIQGRKLAQVKRRLGRS